MKKILSVLVVAFLLVACATNDKSGFFDWNNKVIDSENKLQTTLTSSKSTADKEKELTALTDLIATGDKIELDKETKELFEKAKKSHLAGVEILKDLIAVKDPTGKGNTKYNNLIEKLNKNGDEINTISTEIEKIQ